MTTNAKTVSAKSGAAPAKSGGSGAKKPAPANKTKPATPPTKAKVVPPKKALLEGGAPVEEAKRTFTVVSSDIGKAGGRYYALTPMQAGTKAGRQLFHSLEKPEFARHKGSNTIHFTVRETTRKAGAMTNRPVYKYVVTRTQKKNPREVVFTSKTANGDTKKSSVAYMWDYTVRKASE